MNAITKLITAVGGPQAMADRIKAVRPSATIDGKGVHNWKRRGSVPATYVNAVDEVAIELNRHDLVDALEQERMAALQANRKAA